jgi:hypothetical protein
MMARLGMQHLPVAERGLFKVASGGVNARVISQTRSTATAPSNDTPHVSGTTGSASARACASIGSNSPTG